MLPVSGALQLKTCGASAERPISSAHGAYSTLERPTPCSSSGMNRFQRPAERALRLQLGDQRKRLPGVRTGGDAAVIAGFDRLDLVTDEGRDTIDVVAGAGEWPKSTPRPYRSVGKADRLPSVG